MPGPVGGPCLEKDSYLLNESMSWNRSLSLSAREVNESIVNESLDFLQEILMKHSQIDIGSDLRVGILGIAFKGVPETNDLRGSLGVTLITELKTRFPSMYLSAFDPVVTKKDLGDLDFDLAENSALVFKNANLVIVTNNHPEFSTLDLGKLSNAMSGSALIYDLWGRYKTAMLDNGNLVAAWGAHGLAKRLIR